MNALEARALLRAAGELGLAADGAPGSGECLAGVRGGTSLAVELRPAPAPSKRRAFSSKPFQEPALRKALEDFHALCPVDAMEIGAKGWALILAPGTTWPAFLRCDVAAGFAGRPALNLLLRDRAVVELRFDGEALWAWVS